MIFGYIQNTELEALLRIDTIADYPQINALLKPAVEQVMRDAVGNAWITENVSDPTVMQCACALLSSWFDAPEMLGTLTPGANFLLTQLQVRAEGGGDGG